MFVFRRITVLQFTKETRKVQVDVYHCGAVVKELLERVDQPGWTPVDAVFCFFVSFLVSFFNTIFLFGLISLFLLLTLLVMNLDQYIF